LGLQASVVQRTWLEWGAMLRKPSAQRKASDLT